MHFVHFNSIKVRLKQLSAYRRTMFNRSFQFHKGTIKTMEIANEYITSKEFQFHKGTIKT